MNTEIPQYAVKITVPGSEEADIYDLLRRRGLTSSTHTLSVFVLRSEDRPPVIVLPYVSDLTSRYPEAEELPDTLRHFAQILEVRTSRYNSVPRTDVAYLWLTGRGESTPTAHCSLGIALTNKRLREHFSDHKFTLQDICMGNMLLAHPLDLEFHEQLELDKIYLIDFGGAMQLGLGPGHQPAIDLPGSQIRKPNPSMERFDPYAWDMYCVGITFDTLARVSL